MITTKHTPAPWRNTTIGAMVMAKRETVCHVPQGKNRLADAQLISAAPDLLEAGEVCLAHIRHQVTCNVQSSRTKVQGCNCGAQEAKDALEAAIAKAKGGAA